MRLRLLLASFAAVAMCAGIAVQPQAAEAQQRDWTKTIVQTLEGGYRMGNPAAPVTLIEYGSLTCSHCAHFAEEGMPAILAQVRSGRINFEFRNFVLNPVDVAATLLSRCVSPANYFRATDRIYGAQTQWLTQVTSLTPEQQKAVATLPPLERPVRLAQLSGLTALAQQDGLTPAKAAACLKDEAAVHRLVQIREAGTKNHQVEGTPSSS